jgi:exopolysaccharide biosynthesis predicted pyruvyltransferase EpsI
MSSLFDKPEAPSHNIVFYLHGTNSAINPKQITSDPVMINYNVTMSDVLKHLASGEIVVTTSYHGAYWATLLGRRVIVIKPWSTKFMHMKHSPVLLDSLDWLRSIDQAVAYPNALEECRAANVAFYDKVVTLLANID